jgi:hypothetical protein
MSRLRLLADKLDRLPHIKRLAMDGEPGGWRIAFTILEIEESSKKLVGELMKALEAAETAEDIDDAMHSIKHELDHIDYHLKDSGLYE